ncbi:beta-galactosidase [Steroidobacter sp. S1-65]|uniref:Beta-galactosidase n=1 Tax=Steroidobacter gossypii TaxID=2805490 RepID=A0ABS1WVJ9_9GAMM|nr:beta-galactosidase [Steroidobacter gossypii]MBM0105005.1 beta-galactosidase [Steroidobacter gossypii]
MFNVRWISPRLMLGCAAILCISLAGPVQAASLLEVDASRPGPAVQTGHLKMGTAVSPRGETLEVNSRYLTRNGKPWFPVMGEFHYTRYPRAYWEEELRKIKAAGVQIVASYVFWNHHEERAGEFNWNDDRDLRAFVDLCGRLDLYVVVRLGPWAHGEARYGGTPDWVVTMMPTRRNDSAYLQYTERFWRQVGHQLQGRLWKDGGPIIGVQLENEYNLAGEGRGPEHISTLKKLALEIGFDVPYYNVTGWDGALYPVGEVLPVFAGYPDDPWDRSASMLPPKEVYAFRFDSRVAGNVGTLTAAAGQGSWVLDADKTPFLGAEFGGGVPAMYRRRPHITADDIGAMLPVQLGSGVNLYGYYMFHGGSNPQGHTTLEESTLIGGYNDTPIISYDFQAPIGQYGTQHESLGRIRRVHHFLDAFGSSLAPMHVHAPARLPASPSDLGTLRFSVRGQGDRGFLFASNYVRQYPMPAREDVQFSVKLPSGELVFPQQPIDIPSGAYFIWPINLSLSGVNLRYATAQPVTRLDDQGTPLYVFFAQPGIPVEFAFDQATVRKVSGGSAKRTALANKGVVVAAGIKPSTAEALRVVDAAGNTIRIMVLSEEQSRQFWVTDLGGRRRGILTSGQLLSSDSGLIVRNLEEPTFRIGVLPALDPLPSGNLALRRERNDGLFQTFEARTAARQVAVTVQKIRAADAAPKIMVGGTANAALQPAPEQFGRSAAWTVTVAPNALEAVSDAYLDIDYQGDVGRLFAGTTLIDDNYYNGITWRVGLKRFHEEIRKPLTLTVLPLRDDAPIYIEHRARSSSALDGQLAEVVRARVVPEYELRLDVPGAH